MEKFQSLADFLGVEPGNTPSEPRTDDLLNISDPTTFCQRVLNSREFRQYILNGITLGDIPPAVMCRIIDHAWGKPVDHVEHTGKVETITEVRRVVVHVDARHFDEELDEDKKKLYTRH